MDSYSSLNLRLTLLCRLYVPAAIGRVDNLLYFSKCARSWSDIILWLVFISPYTLPQNNRLNCTIVPSEGYMGKSVKSNRNHEDNNITICLIRVFDAELVPASFLLQAFR